MRATILQLFVFIACFSMPQKAWGAETIQMLNSYVSMKLHLSHSDGQMVGAAWLRFKNTTGAQLTNVPFILNPGLSVTKVTLGNGTLLPDNSGTSEVSGYDYLSATVGAVALPTPLAVGDDSEVVIHYRGKLQAIDWAGIPGATETLNPDFTIIRAKSFGYPVLAAPNKASIEAAINQAPYYQTATVDLPSGYSPAGNLAVESVNGTKFELKSKTPTKAMVLPIARYSVSELSGIEFSTFSSSNNVAPIVSTAKPLMSKLASWLGAPKNALAVTFVPEGYGTHTEAGFLMQEPDSTDKAAIAAAATGLWGLTDHMPGAWDTGLKEIVLSLLEGKDTAMRQNKAFDTVLTYLSADSALSTVPLADIADPSARDAVGRLMFWTLYESLGQDSFMQLAQFLRAELPNSAAGYRMLADVMQEDSNIKAAENIAKNWLTKGRLAKDIKKANSLKDLAKRY